MDGVHQTIFPEDLYARLGTALAPELVDLRDRQTFVAGDRQVGGDAGGRSPWLTGRQVVVAKFDGKPRPSCWAAERPRGSNENRIEMVCGVRELILASRLERQ